MAKNIDKDTVKALSTKNYYSWLKEGEANTEFIVSGSFGSLAFDAGSGVGTEVADIILKDGSTNAKVKTIASTYSYAGAASTTAYAPKSLTVFGVDATSIYGGAVISTKQNNYTSINSGANATYAGTNVVVNGGANLKISTVKASAVYGGGAGYGSILEGGVNISVVGTNTISNLFGGGQKGAVVNGDVTIDIDRTDARSGRISNVWGGGLDAVVNGNVNITIHGTNAETIGTVSGSGKGNKAQVTGYRTLTIADYSGKFATTIKDFDKIVLESGTAITLTQSQQKSIQSADYQFIIDSRSVNQANAMLTWNKNIDTANFYVTIDDEFAATQDDAFTTTIYSSTQLTQSAFDKASWKVYGEDGDEITSGYELKFVADVDNKGVAKTKGGSVVLSYVGSKSELTADSADTELTDAADKVQIKGDLVRASLDTKGGDDRVTVQTETLMAGDIYLGTGNNTLTVQSDAEVTGAVVVDKNSTNTININGTISSIEGGDATTKNIVNINSEKAIGYFDNTTTEYGREWAAVDGRKEVDALEREATFVQHDLNFAGGSHDKVVVSTASAYAGNINFGKGEDTLVLNQSIVGATVTAEDGKDMIVANKTGVTIDANTLKLSGTDNVFVASNGVYATINNAGAIGSFEAQYAGLYLSQNAMINVNNQLATMSFVGDIDLTTLGGGANLTILPVAEQLDRVSEYYVAGDGVNANINAAGQSITLRKGAKLNGTVYDANGLRFMGTAGGEELYFNNDGTTTTLSVDNNAVATVGSIAGLSGQTYSSWQDTFDADLRWVVWGGRDAAVYEAESKNLIVGDATKDIADFAAAYGVGEIKQITVDGIMDANVTFTNANVYTADRWAAPVGFNGDVNFVGANTVNVRTDGLVFDDEQMKFATADDKVTFNVLEGGALVFDGIKNGESYQKNISVTFDKNARFAYGDTMFTKDWDWGFTADELYTDNAWDSNPTDSVIRNKVEFVDGAKIEGGIDLTQGAAAAALPGVEIKIDDGAEVKGWNVVEDAGVIVLGRSQDKLTIGKATVNGEIIAGRDNAKDVISLNGSTVNAMTAPLNETAISLDNTDELEMKDGALVNGDITGGKHVHVKDSEVTGSVAATTNVLMNAKVGAIAGGTTLVESGVGAEKLTSEIGKIDLSDNNNTTEAVTLIADNSIAKVGSIDSLAEDEEYNNLHNYNSVVVEARNGSTIEFGAGVQTAVGGATFTAVHKGSEVKFNGDISLVANNEGNVTMSANAGGKLTGMGDITISGGVDTNGDPIAAMDAIVTNLAGQLQQAGTVVIQSNVTDVLDAEADVAAAEKTVSNLTAGDVNLVARNSTISMTSEGSVNTFGAIRQSGAIAQSGYPIAGTDATQNLTVFSNADSATIAVNAASSFKADSIQQIATTANVAFNGTAEVTNGIVQGQKLDVKNAIAATEANAAQVTFNGAATTLKGSIEQYANTWANVDAAVTYNQVYTTESFAEKVEDIAVDKVSSVIAGNVTQESTTSTNAFAGGVIVNANGDYNAAVAGDTNAAKHKDAKVTFGSVEASYGDISQTGVTNAAVANILYVADGESDVTVNGKSELKMGNVTQYSETAGATANTVAVSLGILGQNQGVLTLKGDVTGDVGAVKQTAFRNSNIAFFGTTRRDQLETIDNPDDDIGYGRIDDEGVKLALTVASVDMLAYGDNANNTLVLTGNTTVTGDVSVGGVLSGEKYVDYAWGDRTANLNTVTVDVDTVEIGGNLALIGLTNRLTLNNNTLAEGLTVNAKNVYVAGDNNTLDLDYGVTMNKIALVGLEDADKIGDEGYDLGAPAKTNTLNVRGTLEGVSISRDDTGDTINVYGGTIKGDIDTKDGADTINVTGDSVPTGGTKNTFTTKSEITGSVTLGQKNDLAKDVLASGNKVVNVASYLVYEKDRYTDATVVAADAIGVGEAKIGGGVKMYTDNTNTLTATGLEFRDAGNKTTFARAEIGGDVAMEAITFTKVADEYVVDNTKGTNVATLAGATVNGKVDMTAYQRNTLNLGQNGFEEYRYPEALGGTIDETTKVTGQLTMKAATNTVSAAANSGNYVNGISMEQSYVAANGNTYATDDGTGVVGTNTVNVGLGTTGGELRVGTADSNADLNMGALYVQDHAAFVPALSRDARLVANPGHDAIEFSATTPDEVLVAAETNAVNVVGRLTANDVNMVADANTVTVNGDGNLGKAATIASVGARTASFTANDVAMAGETANTFTAQGTGAALGVKVMDPTDDTNTNFIGFQEKVDVTVKSITQGSHAGANLEVNNLANDVTVNSMAVLNATGSIKQTGDFTNNVTVDGYNYQRVNVTDRIAYPEYNKFSQIGGNIEQTSTDNADANRNTVALTRTNVGGSIVQTAATAGNNASVSGLVSTIAYFDETPAQTQRTYNAFRAATVGGDVTQSGAYNAATLTDATVGGTISQTATRGANETTPVTYYNNQTNTITAAATATDAARKIVGEGETCPVTGHGALTHNVESVQEQGSFNRQSIGAISQSFTNAADTTATVANNTVNLTRNVNVGDVTQTGVNLVTNTFSQTVGAAVNKLGTYVGERDNQGNEVNKVAYYQDIAAVTAGTIAQTGTINQTTLSGVQQAEGKVINQTSLMNDATVAAKVGSNTVNLNGSTFARARYVKVMTLNTGLNETPVVEKLADSEDKYVKTTVGAILQTSNAQENYTTTVSLPATNTVQTQDLSAVDINGNVTQKIADGADAKLANVVNIIRLTSQGIEKTDLRLQKPAAEYTVKSGNVTRPTDAWATTYTDPDGVDATPVVYYATELSNINGNVAQSGYQNNTTVSGGAISGNVDQTANLIEAYGHPATNLAGQSVAQTANTLNVSGAYDAGVIVTKVADGTDEVVQAESLMQGNVGNVTQTVNDALAKKVIDETANPQIDNLPNVDGDNSVLLINTNFGTVNQATTYGDNSLIEWVTLKSDGSTIQVIGHAVTQVGTDNTVNLTSTKIDQPTAAAGEKVYAISQTANVMTSYDESVWNAPVSTFKASNTLTTAATISVQSAVLDPNTGKVKTINQPTAQYTELGNVMQVVNDVTREFETKIGDADPTKDNYYLDDGNWAVNAATLIGTTAGDVTQTGTGYLNNQFTFSDTARGIYKKNAAETGIELDTSVFENTVGTVAQKGVSNTVGLASGKTEFAATDPVQKTVAAIDQDAVAVKTWKAVGSNYELAAVVNNNTVQNVGGTSAITVGAITQDITNVKYNKITKTWNVGTQTFTDTELKDQYTTGSNIVNVEGSLSSTTTQLTGPKDENGLLIAPSKDKPNTWVNQEFLSSVGDVTQTIAGAAARNKTVDDSVALAGQVKNTVTLKNIDAGTVIQKATGYATNEFISKNNVILDHYTMGTDGYTAVKGTTAAEVTKIDQEGFINVVDVKNLSIGDIAIAAKKVDFVGEVDDGGKKVEKTLQSYGSNTVTLDNVDSKQITAVTESFIGEVKIGGSMKQVVTLSGISNVSLTNGSTATGIKTGDGSDVITFTGGSAADKNTVVGTIDMGGERYNADGTLFNNGDVINVNTQFVDLSKATIKNVEQINVTAGDSLVAAGIDADKVVFTAGAAKLNVQTAKLGSITNIHSIATADATKNFNATFTAGVGSVRITGSAANNGTAEGNVIDTLTIGDGAGSDILTDSTIKDMDVVNFAAGAHADKATAYMRTKDTESGNNNIKFNFTFEEGKKDFVLGKFDNATEAAKTGDTTYASVDVTLNDLTYNSKDKIWTDGGKAYTALNNGEKYYTYTDGVVTTHTYTA